MSLKFNKRNFNAWLHHKPLKESLISQIVKEVLQEHIKHEKMKKKVIKLNEEGLTKIVEKSVKQLLERRELLDEMARVGYMGKKKEFEIYVRTDDPGRIPHFHVRDSSTQGKEFEACVELKTNRYFSHGKYNDKLNTSQRKQLAQFMESPNEYFPNNYMATIYAWNTNNSSEKVEPAKDDEGNIIVPNYRILAG